ncbi:MAG: peptidase, partial [Nitrosopumilus sp.]
NEISFNIIKNTENYDTTIIEYQIPQWIKNNVKWYADGQMMDRDFVLVIKYLIEKGLMDIPDWTEQTQNQEFEIPDWIKNNAKWWSENQISDDEFINGMQFLIENGIIKI